MGLRAEVNTLQRYANMFGFGIRAPTDLLEQTPGLIPDSAYYNRTYSYWGAGNVMNLGIGQGDMGVTPLQLARYISAVGNGGYLHEPRIVAYLSNPDTGDTIRFAPEPTRIPIDPAYFSVVRHGLKQVMEQGSGRAAQIPGIPSGGKTGTAQAPGNMEDHSVFVMFAPYDRPQVAVAVQCENAGDGSACAAPIASLLAERYLKGMLPDSPELRLRMNRARTASSQQPREPNTAACGIGTVKTWRQRTEFLMPLMWLCLIAIGLLAIYSTTQGDAHQYLEGSVKKQF